MKKNMMNNNLNNEQIIELTDNELEAICGGFYVGQTDFSSLNPNNQSGGSNNSEPTNDNSSSGCNLDYLRELGLPIDGGLLAICQAYS